MTTRRTRVPAAAATGTVRGSVITLDSPLPELDGRRVRVLLQAAEDGDIEIDSAQQEALWREWAERGEQGPITDEESDAP